MTAIEAFNRGIEKGLAPYKEKQEKNISNKTIEKTQVKHSSKSKKKKEKKLLKKPLAKGIKRLSAVSAVKNMASNTGALVKEGRTGYFQSEYMEETRWLS